MPASWRFALVSCTTPLPIACGPRCCLYAQAEISHGLVHFSLGEPIPHANRLPDLGSGALAYSSELNWMAIGLAPRVVAAAPPGSLWSPWASMLDDVALLRSVGSGERIAVLLAES